MAGPSTTRVTPYYQIPYPAEGVKPSDSEYTSQMSELDAWMLYAHQASSLIITNKSYAWTPGSNLFEIFDLEIQSPVRGGRFFFGAGTISINNVLDGYWVMMSGLPSGVWDSEVYLSSGNFYASATPPSFSRFLVPFARRQGPYLKMMIPNGDQLT